MQTNILWTGREYYSLENCLVEMTTTGLTMTSTIIGCYEERIYNVAYRIETNQNWETVLLEVNLRHDSKTRLLKFEGDGKGNWLFNGKQAEQD